MLNDHAAEFRDLERHYSMNSYPYADSESSQERLRALGIATDQLIKAPKNPTEQKPVAIQPMPEPPKKAAAMKNLLLPLLLIGLICYLLR